jgi:hypothetical protein
VSRARFVWLALAALAVIAGALFLSTRRDNLPAQAPGRPLLPALASELNSVTTLTVRKGAATPSVTVHKIGDQWAVAERGDYPADVAKVRKLLLSLGDAKIVEEKTSNPANFAAIGVEDPTKVGAMGAEITLLAHDGKHAVIVGKPAGEGTFARRGGENQSFLVEPSISVESEPRSWIDPKLIDVPVATIQSIEVKPATGAGYVVHRLKPSEDGFSLDRTPAGRKAADSHALAPSSTLLSALTAEDVAAAKDIDFSKPSDAILTLSDGNVITLTGTAVGDKRWIEVKATKDAALDSKARDRAFEVASYRYDAIFRPLEQLLVPKETPAAAAAGKTAAPGHKRP